MSCIQPSDVEEKKLLAPVSWYAPTCDGVSSTSGDRLQVYSTARGRMQGGSSFQRMSSLSAKGTLIGGEVFGSLPKAMSMEQRQSVKENVGLSPSLSHLGSLKASLPAVRFKLSPDGSYYRSAYKGSAGNTYRIGQKARC